MTMYVMIRTFLFKKPFIKLFKMTLAPVPLSQAAVEPFSLPVRQYIVSVFSISQAYYLAEGGVKWKEARGLK